MLERKRDSKTASAIPSGIHTIFTITRLRTRSGIPRDAYLHVRLKYILSLAQHGVPSTSERMLGPQPSIPLLQRQNANSQCHTVAHTHRRVIQARTMYKCINFYSENFTSSWNFRWAWMTLTDWLYYRLNTPPCLRFERDRWPMFKALRQAKKDYDTRPRPPPRPRHVSKGEGAGKRPNEYAPLPSQDCPARCSRSHHTTALLLRGAI